jgi:hypothetical protein
MEDVKNRHKWRENGYVVNFAASKIDNSYVLYVHNESSSNAGIILKVSSENRGVFGVVKSGKLEDAVQRLKDAAEKVWNAEFSPEKVNGMIEMSEKTSAVDGYDGFD